MSAFPAPSPSVDEEAFWLGGRDGRLLVQRCEGCGTWQHPPTPLCSSCHADRLSPQPVSGRGTVHAFTVNRQPWVDGLAVPYVLTCVRLDEQDDLRLVIRLVDCDPADVTVGMAVDVRFEPSGQYWVPVFAVSTGDGRDA